jgi:hypothetical protein
LCEFDLLFFTAALSAFGVKTTPGQLFLVPGTYVLHDPPALFLLGSIASHVVLPVGQYKEYPSVAVGR